MTDIFYEWFDLITNGFIVMCACFYLYFGGIKKIKNYFKKENDNPLEYDSILLILVSIFGLLVTVPYFFKSFIKLLKYYF